MSEGDRKTVYGDNWPRRRRYMTIVLLWAMANVNYILIFGQDNAINQNALVALITLIASIIGAYVFGAVWDDADKRKNLGPGAE